jgi:hypothetical protein
LGDARTDESERSHIHLKGRLLVDAHRDAGGGLDYRALFVLAGDADKPKLAGMFLALP